MTSQINPNNIDGNYPVAGQPNNTQGFRDNFTNTKTNLQYAASEITDLQNKAVLKEALAGTTLNNNMNDGLIYAVKLQDVSYTYMQNVATTGPITIDYTNGQYQYITTTGSISLSFTNWPISGTAGSVDVAINITNTAYTVTLPAAVTLGTTGVQGLSGSVITFAATGTYQFRFFTVDSGTTITLFDLNRPLSSFTNAVSITAATAATSTTTGALKVTGGIGTGGNIFAGGLLQTTGNAKVLAGTAVPAGGTAGAGIMMSSTTNLGVFFGSGVPTLSAAQGSLYIRTDGSSTSTRLYVNTNGTTGWTAVTTAS